ncbi:MAG: hypothetical protein HDQ95_07215 [Roseburia sp.]|nr:hypothetical protein [Roseburia sp.]
MKIKKIQKKLNLQNSNNVKLQGCYDDCTEYFQNTADDYNRIHAAGYPADGKDSAAVIAEIYKIFGVYCYKTQTVKTTYLW